MTHQVEATRRGHTFVGILLNHPSFQGSDAIVAKCYAVVRHEGPKEGLFDNTLEDAVALDDDGNFMQEVDPQLYFATNCAENIVMVCNQGYNVDDDNEPAPENIP